MATISAPAHPSTEAPTIGSDDPTGRGGRTGAANRWSSRRLPVLAAAAAGGALTAVATPPWGAWPLAIAGLAVLVWLLLETAALGWRRRWLTGFAWAAGMFAITLFWMGEFHAVGYTAAFVGYAAFYGTALAAVPLERMSRPWAMAAVPAALTVIEWIRDRFPFGGVPLGSIEIGQAAGPLVPAARLFGGLSLLTLAAVVGAAIAVAVHSGIGRRGPRAAAPARWVPLQVAATILSALAVPLLGLIAPDGGPDGPPVEVGVVQGGGERGLRAVFTDSQVVFERHRDVAERLDAPLDLVVWPENAIDVPALEGSDPARTLSDLAERVDATVIAGVTEDADDNRFVNVAYAWAPTGNVVDAYVKVKRVPFGEYVPGRALFERIVDLSILPKDAVAGSGPGVLRTPAGDYGVAISYEVFFADRSRDAVRAGAEALLVPTNASSFTTSQVPTQQVASARLRAWETGRWLVQAAPTGYSAVVDPAGNVIDRSVLGEDQTLNGTIALRSGRTLYVRWGDVPLIGACLGLLIALWARRRPT